MDEEDIAVPSSSLNNRLGVVYEASQSGNRRVETVRKFGYGDSQCEAILGVSHRENPCPVPRVAPVLYNWAAIKIPEGVTMSNLAGLAAVVSELRKERANQVNELKHLDAALSVLGKLHGGSSYAEPRRTLSAAG